VALAAGESSLEGPPIHAARYQVDRANTVAEACSHLEAYSYDLVVADARLPDGTGMNVADRAGKSGIRTLIVTGDAFYPELWGCEYLLKQAGELLRGITRLLGAAG
jgi:CheY-like chemotaxis protein